ncbi:MAG TPA: integrase arm-type DNA-binding domain-containing protein [Burkholderiales bacterium]|nr:integrase arm-type DNA-binding domain-containing protein [Burkholderiales bacterium]
MATIRDLQVRNWVNAGKPLAISDGDGLTFTLSSGGTASWVLRYRFGGKQRELTLGRYPDMTLAAARKLAAERRVEVQQGIDVARKKQLAKLETAREWTFKRLADDYLERAGEHLAALTIAGRRQQLRDYVHGRIGHLSAREVSPGEIVEIVERSGEKSLHVARLVLIALREVFAHGVARHVLEADPCAHIKAKAIIGAPPSRRARIMLTDAELVAMLAALPAIGRQNELTAKILLATCTRIGELTRAEWIHVNFERREWTIPPEHAKNKRNFVIPLTEEVAGWFVELRRLAFDSGFVLPLRQRHRGRSGDAPMEATSVNAAFNRLHDKLGDRSRRFTPHDLRSTARSHLGALGVDVLIAERCLNHSLGGLVAVYDKHDYLPERRRALDLWSNKIAALEKGEIFNVVPFRRAANE